MEENAVTTVIEMQETAVSTLDLGEQTAPTETESIQSVSTESNVSENENVPVEHLENPAETSVPENTENADDVISSIVAEAVSDSLEEAGVEVTQTETAVVSEPVPAVTEITEKITEMQTEAEITTEVVTESVTETAAITETVQETPTADNMLANPYLVMIPIAAAGLAFGARAMTKKKRKNIAAEENENAPMSAREKDAVRLAANKPDKKKSRKSKKDKGEKERKNLSKKVLSTLPYRKVLSDDIFFLGKKMYSKAYTFDDINFNLADEEQQYMYLERYIEFLGILDDSVDCQICCWNSRVNMEEFKKATLMHQKADELFDFRHEFNTRVLEANIRKGQNAIQKHMYITLTIKAPDEETAVRRFRTLDITATNTFNRIGNTALRALTSQERIEMLRDFFVGADEMNVPVLTEDFANGREKLYCSPDYFDFKKDYFMFNDKYAKVLYIREYPSTATSDILTGLLGTGIEIMVTTNIETYDSAEARKLVQHQITAVDTDMAKREVKAAQHGNFSSQMPQRIKNQRDAMVSVFDKITVKDQKLFMVNTQILIKADTFDELNESAEVIESTLKRSGCIKGEMAWEQEHGMADCLPLGYQRKFDYLRTMPSESVAIFMPFNVREVQMEHATYYGMNVLSHNLILFDRVTGLINPSGFYLAASGGGKSFKVKTEITNIITGDENADVLVIDPEREYWKLAEAFGGEVVRFSNGSTNYINMFDFDFRLLDDPEVDIIADKCQLVTSFISCMDAKHPLNAQEKSFVDRCVQKAYAKSGVLKTLDPKDIPTLGTFLECMKEETENVPKEMKDKLIITIDMYVNGSAKYFNNQTNVNTKNRFIAYDIRDLNGNLKTQSMLLILDYIWNRLAENKEKGRKTYIFIDEAHLLFADEYSLDYLQMLWKRARKYGGILTGITQNVDDLLKDYKSRNMLANSEFIVLLKQNPTDAAKLQDVLNINDSEIQFVNDVPAGHGLLILGGKTKIPFYDEFPKDTTLYSLMSTNFSETMKMMNEGETETA